MVAIASFLQGVRSAGGRLGRGQLLSIGSTSLASQYEYYSIPSSHAVAQFTIGCFPFANYVPITNTKSSLDTSITS